jgi:TetR/AcrR family transcriptional regulator, cholesterol catabolism regulator
VCEEETDVTKIRDREQLLDAAAKVFAEKGFEAARLEDIAAELGVLQGSLYYHVASKADLLALVLRRRHLAIIERLECIAASNLPPGEKLATAVREHLRHIDEFFPESAQWFVEPTPGRESEEGRKDRRAMTRRHVDVFENILQQGVDAGELRPDIDLHIAVRGLIGMCNWLPRWYIKGGRLSIDEISEVFVRMVVEGLGGRE